MLGKEEGEAEEKGGEIHILIFIYTLYTDLFWLTTHLISTTTNPLLQLPFNLLYELCCIMFTSCVLFLTLLTFDLSPIFCLLFPFLFIFIFFHRCQSIFLLSPPPHPFLCTCIYYTYLESTYFPSSLFLFSLSFF